MQALQNVDRRIIYVLMIIVCIYALMNPMGLPISYNELTEMCRDQIENLNPGDIMYIGFEFSAGGVPELVPALKSAAKMAFEQGARIVTGALWLEGQGLGGPAVREIADLLGKEYGTDYVQIGYRPGGEAFLELAATDFWAAATDIDEDGTPLAELPLMQDFKSMADADLVFIFVTGTPGELAYIKCIGDPLGVPICLSCIAVAVPGAMPFVRSGQLKGMLMGMRGAAEFEIMAGIPGPAVAGMDAQSLAHVLIILFIIIGNVAYLFSDKKGGRA